LKYEPAPFGSFPSANANPATLVNRGENSWVTLRQVGNKLEREYYRYMTQIFNDQNTRPASNGEPYYSGYGPANCDRGVHEMLRGTTAPNLTFCASLDSFVLKSLLQPPRAGSPN
jgi:hypothetical protein